MPKILNPNNVRTFTDIPNVGPRIARDFERLCMKHPSELIGKDPFLLYQTLCARDGVRHDPCVLDVFMAVVDFMNGAQARPWWFYTPERKRLLKQLK